MASLATFKFFFAILYRIKWSCRRKPHSYNNRIQLDTKLNNIVFINISQIEQV
jgi:hypothetical protein